MANEPLELRESDDEHETHESSESRDELLEEYRYPTMFGEAEVFTLLDEDDDTEDSAESNSENGTSNRSANGKPSSTPIRVLYVGGGFQSATYLGKRRFEPVFEYYRAFDHMFEAPLTIKNVLMIGGGAYSYPKHLLTTHADVAIDVVEIDPAIVNIARKHFYLDELERAYGGTCSDETHGEGETRNAASAPCRLRTFIADGVAFLEKAAQATTAASANAAESKGIAHTSATPDVASDATGARTPGAADARNHQNACPEVPYTHRLYDALINDSFDGTNPTGALLSQKSIQNAKACLAPGGLYLLNVVTDDEDTSAGSALRHEAMCALANHFACVYEIPCIDLEYSGADNYLVIATDTPCAFTNCASALIS